MNVRQRRRAIWLAAAVVGLAAAGVIVGGLLAPVEASVASSLAAPNRGAATTSRAGGPGPAPTQEPDLALADLQRVCAIDLLRPLYDPPSQTPAVSAAPRNSSLTVRLIGTADEPGHSVAILQKRDGSVEVCAAGEGFDAEGGRVTVTQVEHEKAVVEYGGKRYELVVPPRP